MSSAAGASGESQSLVGWTLSFLRPYRGRVVLLAFCLLMQIALGALQPWPLKIIIDYVLSGASMVLRLACRSLGSGST